MNLTIVKTNTACYVLSAPTQRVDGMREFDLVQPAIAVHVVLLDLCANPDRRLYGLLGGEIIHRKACEIVHGEEACLGSVKLSEEFLRHSVCAGGTEPLHLLDQMADASATGACCGTHGSGREGSC